MTDLDRHDRTYGVIPSTEFKRPDYSRIIETLTDAEVLSELAGQMGEPNYQIAVRREAEKRGLTPA